MAFKSREAKAQEKESKNVLQDPELRKKFKQVLVVLTTDMSLIDQRKEAIKETVAEASSEYGMDKKLIRKIASTMYKQNYGSLQEENHHFEILYETIVEGRLRDEGSSESPDPLDSDAE